MFFKGRRLRRLPSLHHQSRSGRRFEARQEVGRPVQDPEPESLRRHRRRRRRRRKRVRVVGRRRRRCQGSAAAADCFERKS